MVCVLFYFDCAVNIFPRGETMRKTLIAIAMMLFATPLFAQTTSEAEILGAMYGTVIGNIDHCNITLNRSLVERMGERLAATAKSSADKDRAIIMFQQVGEAAQQNPTMDCETVRWVLELIKEELY